MLVDLLNRNPQIGFDLTLTVGGSVITGTAVGAAAYWKIQLAENVGNSMGLDFLFESGVESALAAANRPGDIADVTFIHLVDATHWQGEVQLPTNSRLMWRGRLSEVQGWTLGRLGERPDPSIVNRHADALKVLQERVVIDEDGKRNGHLVCSGPGVHPFWSGLR